MANYHIYYKSDRSGEIWTKSTSADDIPSLLKNCRNSFSDTEWDSIFLIEKATRRSSVITIDYDKLKENEQT